MPLPPRPRAAPAGAEAGAGAGAAGGGGGAPPTAGRAPGLLPRAAVAGLVSGPANPHVSSVLNGRQQRVCERAWGRWRWCCCSHTEALMAELDAALAGLGQQVA